MSNGFKGTTAECFAHVVKTANSIENRKILASFLGVNLDSVTKFFRESCLPVAEPLIRLWAYLEFLGYDVEELSTLNPAIASLARVLGFRVVNRLAIIQFLGYPDTVNSSDHVLRLLQGKRGTSEETLRKFKAFANLHAGALAEKKQTTPRINLSRDMSDDVPSSVGASLTGSHDATIKSLAEAIKAVMPLAEVVNSDAFTSTERARVRELVGADGVFTLSNNLFGLCGERSRDMHKKGGRNGH